MKRLILLIALAAAVAFAQATPPNPVITTGPDSPASGLCGPSTAGTIYVRSENPSNGPIQVLRCTQTAAYAYAWHPISHYVGATLPATCAVGDIGFSTGATAGQNLYGCSSANTWTSQAADGGGPVTATTGAFSGVISTPGITYNSVTVLPPGTTVAGRLFRYTHDSASGACSGTGTASSLCYSDGTATWIAITGSGLGVPGGSTGQVQYANGSSFAGDSGLAYNSTSKSLGVIGGVVVGQSSTGTGSITFNGVTSGSLVLKPADAATNSVVTLPGVTGTLAVGPGAFATSTDPTCTAAGHIGKLWFDTTTNTTALKVCKSVSGSVGWSAVTTTP